MRSDIPESLCWHVLGGITQALLWLHYGHKHTFPFDQHIIHDDDWHPVIIAEINPTNSKTVIKIALSKKLLTDG